MQHGKSLRSRVRQLTWETRAIGLVIRKKQADSPSIGGTVFTWPLAGSTRVISRYGMRRHPLLGLRRLHTGIDIIGVGMGAPVHAISGGRIIMVRKLPSYGWIVVIDHGGGLASVYAHLSSVAVAVDQTVESGAAIGTAGRTGKVTGPHLHLEIRYRGEPVDPLRHISQVSGYAARRSQASQPDRV